MKRNISTLLLASVIFILSGCALQTKIIERRHWQLNDTIRETHIEQLLLNIVRLRYDDTPYFLKISSISTQFAAEASTGATGTLQEGASSILGLSGGMAYSESPVVTWSLPDSRDLYSRLLAPMGADQLTSLMSAGWEPTRVLRVGIKKMNHLRNREFRVEDRVFTPSTYDDFVKVLQLINELSREDLIDLAYGVKSTMGAGKIPLDKLDTRAIPAGLPYGLQFLTRDDPNVFEPLKLSKPLFLRFSKQSDSDPRARRLRELLNLNPSKYSFGIVDTGNSGTEQLRSESGKVSQVFDPDTDMAEIVLNNRSMMEVLYFASAYVQVPEAHLSSGAVRGGGLIDHEWLTIPMSSSEPSDAWVKVKYLGNWFYIGAYDLRSRTSFALLDALFESVVGNVPGANPLLTLPVKGKN
jgi:hypothetical protein